MTETPNTEMLTDAAAPEAPAPETSMRRFISDFTENRIAVCALIVLLGIVLIAIFAPLISPQNPYDLAEIDILDGRLPPGSESMTGMTFWLRFLCTFIVLAASYFGVRTDALIMRLVDLQLSFPAILIALMLLAILGRGVDKIVIALIAVQWAYYARTVRGSALVERSKEYIEAAHGLALSKPRIVFRHMMPNVLPPLIVVGTVQVAHAILLEATLSFLGIGVPITKPSLGLLIFTGFEYMMSGKYWISFFPGIALLITIVSINLVGDQLRDVLNPRLRR
jgi:peptide/nickel transport system permease protein